MVFYLQFKLGNYKKDSNNDKKKNDNENNEYFMQRIINLKVMFYQTFCPTIFQQ